MVFMAVRLYERPIRRRWVTALARVNRGLCRHGQSAAQEGRSAAQICEAFLRAGSEGYKKEGPKLLRRFLGRQKSS
jgi:hypothetical protein